MARSIAHNSRSPVYSPRKPSWPSDLYTHLTFGTVVHETEVAVGWWVAKKDAPLAYVGPTEINEEAAKRAALAKSQANPGTVFQVRHHMNANAPTEVRWEAKDGRVTEGSGSAAKGAEGADHESGHSRRAMPAPEATTVPTPSSSPPAPRGTTMRWYHYVAYFFGGAFLANAVPHFVNGVSGRPFQSPFASPPGEGLSSSTVNVLWGLFNLAVGYALVCRVGSFELRRTRHVLILGLGVLAMAIMLSRAFGKFYGGL